VVIFGHTHIPMALVHGGVLLVNPGALATGGWTQRQRCQTVALLFVLDAGDPVVVHLDLSAPERAFVPQVRWEAGYAAALRDVTASILSPALAVDWERVATCLRDLPRQQARSLLLRVTYPCWNDGDLLAAVRTEATLPDAIRERLEALLGPREER
jgi:hypothetical protein